MTTGVAAHPGPATDPAAPAITDRALAMVLTLAGGLGLSAAFVLAVEKYRLLTDPFYVPTCTVNATISCAPVMSSDAASVFGFPNPLLGIAGFTVVIVTGAALLAGATLSRWYWAGLQVGTSAGVLFVGWLLYQSVLVIGALCPYCLVVWATTITTSWYVTLYNLRHGQRLRTGRAGRVIDGALRYHSSLLAVFLVLLAALIAAATAWGQR